MVKNISTKFKRQGLIYIIMPICLFMLSSCTYFQNGFAITRANYYFDRGSYQRAILIYKNRLADGFFPDWLRYNLGVSYASLGEKQVALKIWSKLGELDNAKIAFRLHYNKGITYYQLGEYGAAKDSFSQALRLKPSDINTKINLERTLEKLNYEEQLQVEPSKLTPESLEEATDRGVVNIDRLLEFFNAEEELYWDKSIAEHNEDDW